MLLRQNRGHLTEDFGPDIVREHRSVSTVQEFAAQLHGLAAHSRVDRCGDGLAQGPHSRVADLTGEFQSYSVTNRPFAGLHESLFVEYRGSGVSYCRGSAECWILGQSGRHGGALRPRRILFVARPST